MAITPARGIRIPDDLWEQLLQATQEDGTSVTQVARKALQDWLDQR